jgi:hypothetical protein
MAQYVYMRFLVVGFSSTVNLRKYEQKPFSKCVVSAACNDAEFNSNLMERVSIKFSIQSYYWFWSIKFKRIPSLHKILHTKKNVKLSLCLINLALCHEDMWGSGGIAPPFLISALHGGEWSYSRIDNFTHRKKSPRYPLGRRTGRSHHRSRCCEVKPYSCRESNPGRPARSPSLYRLSYTK